AVVTSAQELRAAINANKSTICVYGHIDLGNITSELILNNNQKLVGIGYFGDFDSEIDKFSKINAITGSNYLFRAFGDNELSDLEINVEQTTGGSNSAAVSVTGNLKAHNVNVSIKDPSPYVDRGVFYVSGGNLELSGKVNIVADGIGRHGILCNFISNINILEEAQIDIFEKSGNNLFMYTFSSDVTIGNNVNVLVDGANMFNNYIGGTGDYVIKSGAVYYSNNNTLYRQSGDVSLTVEKDGILAFKNGNNIDFYRAKKDFEWEQHEDTIKYLTKADIAANNEYFEKINYNLDVSSLNQLKKYYNDGCPDKYEPRADEKVLAQSSEQYLTAMTSFDEMIADSSYQGVNLLKGGKLTTMFNEDRTHSYTINGKDMSSNNIGIVTREWVTKDDIAQSIKEIQNAMNAIRDEVARLGNNLSIIETRMNFTDAMCDVLQTGADDLVLADMNEESANYLALQTRNSLAVNALALAAQSNNAVLKLF
ncbi:MAG: hypothetical protein IKK52_01630, partial [Alphaproteobacteria bacterium]|nr:hypothetical protein [Alphaproteobacteria bacterium]